MYNVKNQYIKLGKLDINIDLFDFVKNEVVWITEVTDEHVFVERNLIEEID